MNSYWIEQQARQRIDDFAADARGDQLVRDAEAPGSGRQIIRGRLSLVRAWIGGRVVRSRGQVVQAR